MNRHVLPVVLAGVITLMIAGQAVASGSISGAVGTDLFCLHGHPDKNGTQGPCVFWVCGEPYPCVCWQAGFLGPVTSPCNIVADQASTPVLAVGEESSLFCLHSQPDKDGNIGPCVIRVCMPGTPCVCFDTLEMIPCPIGSDQGTGRAEDANSGGREAGVGNSQELL